ncbi:hypothetical protein N0V84_011443 [Fusarium piperis]|uniref:Peptidase M12A domain-containing protein n=1 Tax=Fusarium piperis TaxID=1435070 RepID=A0A9W8W0P4_9HYPO|nr:hypothetical protein N0V84_011443 [Fusarium piperis]
MCGMAENRLLWPVEKHWLNVRFLNGDWAKRRLVRSTVEENFHSLPMGIKFYFYRRGQRGKADIRIKFSNISHSRIGTDAKSVLRGQPTMKLNFTDMGRSNDKDQRLALLRNHILHEFGHALGLQHEHQHPKCGKKWDMAVIGQRLGWSRALVQHNYDPHTPEGKTLEPYDPKSIMHYRIKEGDELHSKATAPTNMVLSEGDKRILSILYPPRGEGMLKPPGDNSESWSPKKQKWWKRLIRSV